MFVCNSVSAFVLLKRDKHSQEENKQWKLQFPLFPAVNIQHELCPTLSINMQVGFWQLHISKDVSKVGTVTIQPRDCSELQIADLWWNLRSECSLQPCKFLTVPQARASSRKDANNPGIIPLYGYLRTGSPWNWDPLLLLIPEPH